MFIMKNEVIIQPSVVSGDVNESADQNISQRKHFTISKFFVNSHKFQSLFFIQSSQIG
jgi:hypothetical protein